MHHCQVCFRFFKVKFRGVKMIETFFFNWTEFEPSAVPSDYVNCQFCGRNFNRTAAERHIPFCETQSKRQKINNSANHKGNPRVNTGPAVGKAPLPGNQRKQSSEVNNRYQNNDNSNGHGNRPNNSSGSGSGGFSKGYSNVSSGNERRPIKYDSQ